MISNLLLDFALLWRFGLFLVLVFLFGCGVFVFGWGAAFFGSEVVSQASKLTLRGIAYNNIPC